MAASFSPMSRPCQSMSRRVLTCQNMPVTLVPRVLTGGPVVPSVMTSLTGSCSGGMRLLRRADPAFSMSARVRIGTWRQSSAVIVSNPATGA